MPRKESAARRLVVGDSTYLWSVRHAHHVVNANGTHCVESVVLRRDGDHGSLRIAFVPGPGRYVPDGFLPSGAVSTGDGVLNLHKPGTVRALLDEALARGWDPGSPNGETLDGWTVFATVLARREAEAAAASDQQAGSAPAPAPDAQS
ncbi:hypothetical protein [Streptomyces sp. NBC_01198]|uniref:hypothetical protein n=1 Tax=Streptomyces sp. NBC_01198 TaxID=2903769 RepID=UPI002E121394|nr:hypothetical protein OG702_14140 [Streptomyces sp. NBC_01198]